MILTPLLIALLIVGGIVLMVMTLVRFSATREKELVRKSLLDQAKREYPNFTKQRAVDCLYVRTLREIKLRRTKGADTNELEDTLTELLELRNHLIASEVERDSKHTIQHITR